ncbi:MAG: glycosyltransferase family 4 protein [Balneolales bacterium]
MKLNILLIDTVSAKPYSVESLQREPLGGTEATVLRIARALSEQHNLTIAQSSRPFPEVDRYGINYVPYLYKGGNPVSGNPDHVIVIRAYKILPRIRKLFPESKLYLWMHCFPGKHAKKLNRMAINTNTSLITVSDYHKQTVENFLRKYGEKDNSGLAKVIRIYNPIDDHLKPNQCLVNPTKLVYFSSPHKGLKQVLSTFEFIRRLNPKLQLFVANPGYVVDNSFNSTAGVVNLGALPHAEIIQHVRESFCVFYPQTKFRETFGLVFAEANAIGTPVLAHPIGSTPEILSHNSQLVNCTKMSDVNDALLSWYNNGRPEVAANEEFRCSHVARQWGMVLTEKNEELVMD